MSGTSSGGGGFQTFTGFSVGQGDSVDGVENDDRPHDPASSGFFRSDLRR